ncbi:TraR/DksA C4-type zinc finger protein [Agromyces sp. SYSU K20354]|uniref:TraR/DksA family transcriptional regulator n=1 Tax=Agromyces cavernae TaxID=2898659 RepID=UPI001E362871|nr:TraR/DksA C4-type zinc finger protein [Agromyces cavernae]MCD2442892.1 TraR/DksA C4-type zinc finger protein [Agromyces cavernae]
MLGRKDVMTVTMMTPAQLERFQARLLAERADAEERLVEFDDAMTEVRAARAGATADDEHDPEGPTMTQEWSQRTAVLADVNGELADIDRALARIADGTYGVCARCGKRITVGRLDARPTATLCIDCARLAR